MRKLRYKWPELFKVFFLAILSPVFTYATPTVSGISGTVLNQGTFTITGSGFGTKSPAKPYLFADFSSNGNPSSLGTDTSWAQTQNVTWISTVGYGGKGGMQGTAGNGDWTMRVDASGFSWTDYSQTYIVMRRVKQNFIVSGTNNYKDWRTWPAGGSGYPDMYWASSNGRLYVENTGCATDSGYWSNFNPNSTNWTFQEILGRASSADCVKDGLITLRIDGTQSASGATITRGSGSGNATNPVMYPLHGVAANTGSWTGPSWGPFNQVWFDSVYVDKGWQRAIVCDASTYANCRKFGYLVPSAWSNTSITAEAILPTPDLPSGATAYIYVFDATNTPNASGSKVIIGGSNNPGNPAPTVISVNLSTGSYLGGTVSTATGTGFLSNASVSIGLKAATNVSALSATQIQFTIPAGTPGLSGLDLKVTNTDNQSATLVSTMSYTSAPVNQPPYNVSAGDNWAVTLPSGVRFSGSASDDGLPNPPATLTYLWQQKTGPGTITFSDATSLTPSVTFSSAGTYTVTMTANDSTLSTESAAVTVIVSPAVGISFPWHQ